MFQLFYTSLISSLLSFLGCICTVSTILLFKELQTNMFRLIFYLAISNLITSISLMIPHSNSVLCKTQGFLLTLGSYSGLLWTACMIYSLYKLIVHEEKGNVKLEVISNIFIWVSALVLSSVGIDYYSEDSIFCWISNKQYIFLMILEFHGPFILVLVFDLIICLKIWRFLKTCRESEEIVELKYSALKKFIAYPIILILCYIPVIIHRFFLSLSNNEVIAYLALLGDSLVGFACFLVYVSNKSVRSAIRKSCSRRENLDDVSMLIKS